MYMSHIAESYQSCGYRITVSTEGASPNRHWTVTVSGLPKDAATVPSLDIKPADFDPCPGYIRGRKWHVATWPCGDAAPHKRQADYPDTAAGALQYAMDFLRQSARASIDAVARNRRHEAEFAAAWQEIAQAA